MNTNMNTNMNTSMDPNTNMSGRSFIPPLFNACMKGHVEPGRWGDPLKNCVHGDPYRDGRLGPERKSLRLPFSPPVLRGTLSWCRGSWRTLKKGAPGGGKVAPAGRKDLY